MKCQSESVEDILFKRLALRQAQCDNVLLIVFSMVTIK